MGAAEDDSSSLAIACKPTPLHLEALQEDRAILGGHLSYLEIDIISCLHKNRESEVAPAESDLLVVSHMSRLVIEDI